MVAVTYTLTDFGLQSLADRSPRVIFTASGAGTKGARLFPTTPIVSIPETNGSGTVNLEPTDGVSPEVWYTVSIEHLQPGGQYTHFDILDYRLYVAPIGGPIGNMPGVPLSPANVYVSLDPPPAGFKGFWLYQPTTGQTMPLNDPLIGELRMAI